MAWTEQQQNAIDLRGSSVIVSAAAGSGKTAVLTERIIKLIADPSSGVRADRMIVVTFTTDAAAELKKRLDMKLRALINDNPGDPHLLKQQVLLQNAKISTINSFCFELIRDNITDEGITAGFAVLDDTDDTVLKAQAMDELLNYYSANEYEKISFLYDRFCVKDESQLVEVINLVDKFLASVAISEKWLDTAVNEYKKPFAKSIYYKSIIGIVRDKLERALEISNECVERVKTIFSDNSAAAAVKSIDQADTENRNVRKLIGILDEGRLPDSTEAAELTKFSDLVRTGKAEFNENIRNFYKMRREAFKTLVVKAFSGLGDIDRDLEESAEVTEVLAEVIRKYHELIWARKCAKNALSFADGERMALELLIDTDAEGRIVQSDIAKRTAEYYDMIMIDEYQDSNNKQDLIFKLLSRNYKLDADGEPMYGDNVFLVGDVKQSIYRFRLANPRNFIKTLETSEPYEAGSAAPNKSIVLNRNFRSSKGVIDFVNFIFSQIMTKRCGDIDYTEDEQLYFGAQCFEGASDDRVKTIITLINDDFSDDDSSELLPKSLRKKKSFEAEYTADKISRMLSDGIMVIDADGTERRCTPSDFCILVRSNKLVGLYSEALEERGVPVMGAEEKGYLTSREIAILLDLLRVINNPLNDVSMAAVMTSPMYMFTVGELAYLKSLDRSCSLFTIMKGLAEGGYSQCSDMFLAGRCIDFLNALDGFRLDSVTMTIGELISHIYDTTDFISVMQLQSDGEKKRANLRTLVQFASGYEASAAFEGSGGLGGFLRYTDRIIANGDISQVKTSAASGDYVSVKTLHGSKGLEYPFVFIAETSCLFQSDSKTVMCSDNGRIGYNLYDPTIQRRYKTFQQVMLANEAASDARSEEMRLLYVGLTRARQQLFVNLKCGEKMLKNVRSILNTIAINGGDIKDAVSEARSFSDWLWACLIRSKAFDPAAEKLGLTADIDFPRYGAEQDGCFTVEIAETLSGFEEFAEEQEVRAEPDETVCAQLRSIINSKYDSTLSKMPSKLSVTQITKKFEEQEDFDFKLKRPRFASEIGELSGAERGTAIHTFFQYCDFESAASEPALEIAKVAEMGFITGAQAASISVENVSAFFESDIFKRIRGALKLWRERKFMVAVSQLDLDNAAFEQFKSSDGMIKGIIDLMFEEADGIVIVDYKSDRGISAEKMREKYGLQLRLYRSAIELITGRRVKELYLYSFELKRSIKI